MCIIDELLQDSLSVSNILKYIDDYSIYSYYIGKELELGTRYSSPLRDGDDNPSFSLFWDRRSENNSKIFFKDHATCFKGDVFHFVRILLGKGNPETVPFTRVLQQIDADFNLGLYTTENITMEKPQIKPVINIPEKPHYSINVTSSKPTSLFLNYWKDKYDISLPTLDYYNCTNVEVIHYSSKTLKQRFQVYPKSLCIAYQIGGRYKLYFPFEIKRKKFQNDFPPNWVEGYMQLKYEKDFCIITKSMKEVIFFREHFDWDTIAGKSENTKIPDHLMRKLFKDYKKVFIWLDNDKPGIDSQQSYLQKWPKLIPIVYSEYVTQKDPTDRYEFMKVNGVAKLALEEIKNLIK